jgi:hypothetical protein
VRTLLLAAGALMVLPAVANAMTVAEFLAKADALKAKGMMAMMSADISVLRPRCRQRPPPIGLTSMLHG